MLTREEFLCGSDHLEAAWKRANDLSKESKDAAVLDLRSRVGRLLESERPARTADNVEDSSTVNQIAEPLMEDPPELVHA